METVFRLKASELNSAFLQGLKTLFKEQEIEIAVTSTMDETEYLLKEPANKKRLLEAIDNIKKNKNLIRFSGEEFDKLTNELLRK